MTSNNFRRDKKLELKKLMNYWRDIERWIKKAEQVNKKAVIPAINELRYAGRQLFYASLLLVKPRLSDGDKSSISKRFIIADQYLMNSDHDIVDAIVGFYSKVVDQIDSSIGVSAVSIYCPDYPKFREDIRSLEELIAGSRADASDRKVNYREVREKHLEDLINKFSEITDAEILARKAKDELENQLLDFQKSEKRSTLFNRVCGLCSILSLVFAFWVYYEAQTNKEAVAEPKSIEKTTFQKTPK
ncbi:MAG: hypothetical protein ABJL18_11260 [Hyphomicrobiales bacterium]